MPNQGTYGKKEALRDLQRRYFGPTFRCRSLILTSLSSRCNFFCCRSPLSSTSRLRLFDISSEYAVSAIISKVDMLPLMLCAGVGNELP